MKDDILADPVDIFCNDRIVNKLCLSIYFGGQLTANPYFFLSGSAHFGYDAFVQVSLTNHVWIFVGGQRFGIRRLAWYRRRSFLAVLSAGLALGLGGLCLTGFLTLRKSCDRSGEQR